MATTVITSWAAKLEWRLIIVTGAIMVGSEDTSAFQRRSHLSPGQFSALAFGRDLRLLVRRFQSGVFPLFVSAAGKVSSLLRDTPGRNHRGVLIARSPPGQRVEERMRETIK